MRLVELPVGATEDRVAGSIDLQQALSDGAVHFEPGLLAKAHRGILYVDEVNLLHDHLVDLLLDAAAMGAVTVERDGISVTHSARFVLVGTMNPEEGELRPQLLDRFGLTVEVAAPRDPALRAEVVRRRLSFDADPQAFRAQLRERRRAASHPDSPGPVDPGPSPAHRRRHCSRSPKSARRPASTACEPTSSWRGPPPLMPRGTAAKTSNVEDLRVAARLALPHRRRRNPFDAPGLDEDELDELLPPDTGDGPDPDTDPDGPGGGHGDDDTGDAPAPGAGGQPDPTSAPSRTTHRSGAGEPYKTRLFTVRGVGRGTCRSAQPRPDDDRSAHPVASRAPVPASMSSRPCVLPHRTRSLAAAAAAGCLLRPTDLRRAIREGREANLVVFVVDTSGSMAARERMHQVKTAILSLLLDAYRRRDRVGVVTFRDRAAEIALPPTGSVDIAARRLDDLPAGGRTPLAEGLMKAAEVVRRERLRDPSRRPLLVIVTDGRATAGPDAIGRSRQVAAHLAERRYRLHRRRLRKRADADGPGRDVGPAPECRSRAARRRERPGAGRHRPWRNSRSGLMPQGQVSGGARRPAHDAPAPQPARC